MTLYSFTIYSSNSDFLLGGAVNKMLSKFHTAPGMAPILLLFRLL